MITTFCRLYFCPWLVISIYTLLFSIFSDFCRAESALVIPGTGDSQALLRRISEEYMKQNPQYPVEIPDSIGSSGGIKGVLRHQFEVARTARPLKDREQDGSLVECPFAVSPIVFAAHPSVTGVKNLSSSQVIGIYEGKITYWNQVGGLNQKIYPVDREAGDSSRSIIERHMNGFKGAKSTAKIFYTTTEALDAVKEHKFTIGFLPLGLVKTSGLNIMSIDECQPTPDNIRTGQYPYATIYVFVFRPPLSAKAKKFIDYMYGPDATSILLERGVIPIGKNIHVSP